MKIAQRRKASVEVRKLLLFYSHNSHPVWERSIVNSKTNFVAWKNYMLIAFRNKYYLAYFLFITSSKRFISIERKKNLWNLAANFQSEWNCTRHMLDERPSST